MIGFGFTVAGVVLIIVGLIVLFGPWAAVAAGVVLVTVGLFVPWEELTRAKPAPTPPRR